MQSRVLDKKPYKSNRFLRLKSAEAAQVFLHCAKGGVCATVRAMPKESIISNRKLKISAAPSVVRCVLSDRNSAKDLSSQKALCNFAKEMVLKGYFKCEYVLFTSLKSLTTLGSL